MITKVLRWLALGAAVGLTACGGGDADPTATLKRLASPAGTTPQTRVTLVSDAGDWVGNGSSYEYTRANAVINVSFAWGRLDMSVSGDQQWFGRVEIPNDPQRLEAGTYEATRFGSLTHAALDWSGQGRGCNAITGSVSISNVVYSADNSVLESFDLAFTQHCDGATAALRGTVTWNRNDPTTPPGPVNPPPDTLWTPPFGATPGQGSRYVYLQSTPGDFVGQGVSRLYTTANANLGAWLDSGRLRVNVDGDEWWMADFMPMSHLASLQPGYYGDLKRYPFHNPTKGGLNWSGDGRGCNELTGWFAIDSIVRDAGGALQSVRLRFAQYCDGSPYPLRGEVNWVANEPPTQRGPVPPPANLWKPPAGATPAAGPYLYFESDPGDWVGQGQTALYTPGNATFQVVQQPGLLRVVVNGTNGDSWWAEFKAPDGMHLTSGYYGGLRRYPFHNPAKGGLSWSGNGHGCNELTGWFVIDALTAPGSGNTMSYFRLRFEQHCEGMAPATRGEIVWGVPLEEAHGRAPEEEPVVRRPPIVTQRGDLMDKLPPLMTQRGAARQ